MRYDKLSLLMDQVAQALASMGLFHVTSTGTLVSKQHGVLRTNCMDNLDRTNVVQVQMCALLVVVAVVVVVGCCWLLLLFAVF